jgi:hypothetical protein
MKMSEFYFNHWMVNGKRPEYSKETAEDLDFIEAANKQNLQPFIRNIGRGTKPMFMRNPAVKYDSKAR